MRPHIRRARVSEQKKARDAALARVAPTVQHAGHEAKARALLVAERAAPVVGAAKDRAAPAVGTAKVKVGPAVSTAKEKVGPAVGTAKDKVRPAAVAATAATLAAGHAAREAAKEKVIPAAVGATEAAREKVTPAVESARDRVVDDLLPKLAEAAAAAAAAATAARDTAVEEGRTAAGHAIANLPKNKAKARKQRRRKRFLLLTVLAAAAAAAAAAIKQRQADGGDPWTPAGPATGGPADDLSSIDLPAVDVTPVASAAVGTETLGVVPADAPVDTAGTSLADPLPTEATPPITEEPIIATTGEDVETPTGSTDTAGATADQVTPEDRPGKSGSRSTSES